MPRPLHVSRDERKAHLVRRTDEGGHRQHLPGEDDLNKERQIPVELSRSEKEHSQDPVHGRQHGKDRQKACRSLPPRGVLLARLYAEERTVQTLKQVDQRADPLHRMHKALRISEKEVEDGSRCRGHYACKK